MIDIKLYSSECISNDEYKKRIISAAKKTGREFIFDNITDEETTEKKGYICICSFGYCPGCRTNSAEIMKTDPDAVCLPVLEINGRVAFSGYQADDKKLEQILKEAHQW